MDVLAVAQVLSLVTEAQTRIAVHAFGLFSSLAALNMAIASRATQSLTGIAANGAVLQDYDGLIDDALATIRKSFDASCLAARGLAMDLEEIKARVYSLRQSGDSYDLHKRRWRVKT